ncbi:unnamed protein product [Cylicocyclus nassatus]|uniref:Nucleoside transporter n=1 Tax=Cylicocyclus nassatus TaxID=53992 RepID=A0AA36MAB8_CYLNA|nr:unnamed protein product [Cylicocyclus nassatus]
MSSEATKEKDGGTETQEETPIDKFHLVFIIFLLEGIAVLIPWNMFTTIAPNYYVEYWFTVDGNKTSYAKSFMSALGITAQIPNFSAALISTLQILGGPLMFRVAATLLSNCLCVTAILVLVISQNPSEDAMNWFYIVSLVIVLFLNASNGLFQNCVFGLVADFPAIYTNAFIVGQNICGVVITILAIIATSCLPTQYKTVTEIFFSICLGVLIICVISLVILTRSKFYHYYLERGNQARAVQQSSTPSFSQFVETFKGCWMQLANVTLIFFVTLSLCPAILVGITPSAKGQKWNSSIPKELYYQITVFLVFNIMALSGSTTANFIQIPGPRTLFYFVLARLLFIPYFMLCNYNVDDRVMPVIFENEWFFIIGHAILSYTNGYFSSLAMMYAPRIVPSPLAKTAGMLASLFLLSGILLGVAFTPVIITMVNSIP